MTATPIPRTLAMSVYGDLDVSVIDELPPGRKPIKTLHQYENRRAETYEFIKREIDKGRQAYVVYPLIEESEALDFKNLTEGYEYITASFPITQIQSNQLCTANLNLLKKMLKWSVSCVMKHK